MPILIQNDDNVEEVKIPGPGNFTFSAIRLEDLTASSYTLVTIICDNTGSVRRFSDNLLKMVKSVVDACKKNARAENLLIRYVIFNSQITEIHGFVPISNINEGDYKILSPQGTTALFDATYSGVGATLKMAETLRAQDFEVNGCVYIITDGDDNSSSTVPSMIKDQVNQASSQEKIDSLEIILIGISDDPINKTYITGKLHNFKHEANLTQFVDAGDATPAVLAKLGNLISQSISSISQTLATGQVSQPLNF